MKNKHDVIAAKIAAYFALAAAFALCLTGCRKAPQTEPQPPQPTPTATPTPRVTPQPTPLLDPDADRVKRNVLLNVGFFYRIFVNGEPLKLKDGYEVDALEIPNPRGEVRVLVPLRATGEALGYRVDWQPRKRRVSWNNNAVPAPVTLIDGWSYLSIARFEKWLQRFDNLATAKSARFDRVTGYVQIESKAVKVSTR